LFKVVLPVRFHSHFSLNRGFGKEGAPGAPGWTFLNASLHRPFRGGLCADHAVFAFKKAPPLHGMLTSEKGVENRAQAGAKE
jgi:hypothetical protein